MPSLTKSFCWFVRVDGNHDYLKERIKAINWIDLKQFIAFLHTGSSKENPHTHMLIKIDNELQKQSFDKRLKSHFNITKKSEYSTKVWDEGIEAIAYCYHEDTEPIFNKGFLIETLEKAKEHNKVVQKVIAVNNDKASSRLLDKALAKVNSEDTLEDIAGCILDMIREGESYHPGTFRLKAIIQEVYWKTRSKEDWKYVRQMMIQNLIQ